MAKKSASKKTTKATEPTANQPLKFAKGGFYLDHAEDLWFCTNGKTKKVNDAQTVVLMKATQAGEPVGDESEQLVESFTKQMTGAELKEYRAICQREAEAQGDSQSLALAQRFERLVETGVAAAHADLARLGARQPQLMNLFGLGAG